MTKPSPLASLILTDQETADKLSESRRELINAYERIGELEEAMRGLLGLVQLISHNQDLPLTFRQALTTNHRVIDATEVLR